MLASAAERFSTLADLDGIATGVFYTPGARDVMPSAGLLLRDLDDELKAQRNP